MELGMIGLGRMGANMAERLVRAGHTVIGFDPNAEARASAAAKNIVEAASIEILIGKLAAPRAIWLMVPAGAPVDATIATLLPQLTSGDVIIDGGNSNYKDTMRRSAALAAKQIMYIDAGTSGGIWGLKNGYSMMIGGDAATIERLRPLFSALAPTPTSGWDRVGPSGAGHFAKMIHNGIEYGLMAAYAEGFALLQHKSEFEFDLPRIAEIWREGSVVRSWLLDLTADALQKNPQLTGIAPYVDDSGEGRWTVFEAIDLDVPAPVITAALMQRLNSRDQDSFADKLLAALRNEFGGHSVKTQ
jgi:6-phosphogluconate dehydrogenase